MLLTHATVIGPAGHLTRFLEQCMWLRPCWALQATLQPLRYTPLLRARAPSGWHPPSAVGRSASHSARQSKAPPPKQRRIKLLDACVERFPEHDARVLASLIIQGKVLVDDAPHYKAGTLVVPSVHLRIRGAPCKFVSRAGLKLDAALAHYGVDVAGRTALDAGLSTGGFADCLLQRGAAQVYGVDVGHAQVAQQLQRDARLVVMERTNLRHLTAADLHGPRPDLVTLDLSFISVLTVLPAVVALLAPAAELVSLIKPQFEARQAQVMLQPRCQMALFTIDNLMQVEDGGVVTDPAVHEDVIRRITEGVEAAGFVSHGIFESPIRGAISKNKEFFIHAVKQN